MNKTLALGTAAGLALVACSSESPEQQDLPGTLVAGTAEVTVNDTDLGSTETVQCTPAGFLTTITTGDQTSGLTAVVSKADELKAESVSINNLGGFTGSYNAGLGGEATVSMTGATYHITGVADGFNTDAPSFRTTGTFSINVAC